MAKKKKGISDPFMQALDEMLSGLLPEQQMQLMDNMDALMNSGKSLQDMQEEMYTYQCPDYGEMVKPLADYLLPVLEANKPSEALAAYDKAHEALEKLSHQEQEDAVRNLFIQILADGQSRDFAHEMDTSAVPLIAIFLLVDEFQLMGLFDVILETLKQNPSFFAFYYIGFEDAATLMLAHVGKEHLEELKEMMKTDGFVTDVYPIILNAVIQMAVENPFCRLQVLAWVSDVLKSCIDETIPAMAMDWVVKSLAQIKAVDLLPLIKDIYKKYKVPAVEIKSGIKGVTKLLTKGTDEQIVDFLDFKELLGMLAMGEADDFMFGDAENVGDWHGDWLDGPWEGEDDDERDADALFYKECGLKPGNPKAKPAKKGKQKYALTLDVALKGSPRKVYRQLVVPSDLTLNHLGEILVYAVGWDGYHLNQFIDGKNYYTIPQDDGWDTPDERDARSCTIGSLLRRVKGKIKWEYDFGDSWIHEITLVEKQAVGEQESVKIQLLKGTGACPPEDCGGVYGYRHLLNVLKDPDDEEYEDMVGWLGGSFDPKSFNLSAAKARVEGYARRIKK